MKFKKKSVTFLFLIVVEKSPNISYRAMQYLQNELLTSILCVMDRDGWSGKSLIINILLPFHISVFNHLLNITIIKYK